MSVTELASIKISEAENAEPDPNAIYCRECGVDITELYAGRGRKPTTCLEHRKTRSASNIGGSRGSSDVKMAVANLEQAYRMIGMGLMVLGARTAASDLADSIETLNAQNEQALARDKALCKLINKGGQASGRAGFIIANAMVLIPVAMTAVSELRPARAVNSEEDAPEDAAPFDDFKVGLNGD